MATPELPGARLIDEGLTDLAAGRESEAALLVLVGAPRLARLGVVVPSPPAAWPGGDTTPEHRLYALLARTHADAAHSRYNALIRTLVSFERASACAS